MKELKKKSVGKLIGMKIEVFYDHIRSNQIQLSKARLIPPFKLGDEMALTSVLLSAFRLVREYRFEVFGDIGMMKGGQVHAYTEVSFEGHTDRIDGLVLIVKAGVIRDAAIFEMKNSANELAIDQIERYQQIARQFKIPNFVTVSNQFVSDPTQSPLPLKQYKGLNMRHFSWSYLLTIGHLLLYKNDKNIEDDDQKGLMKEIIKYFEHKKSGIIGVSQLSKGWVSTSRNILAKAKLKQGDPEVEDTVRDWIQVERNLSLNLSKELGSLITTGPHKYRGNLLLRIKDDCKALGDSNQLCSIFRIKGAASDIEINANFDLRTVEFLVSLVAPGDKTMKGQVGWIRAQLQQCDSRAEKAADDSGPSLFDSLAKNLWIDVAIKNSPTRSRYKISDLDTILVDFKGREIREFKIVYSKPLGETFGSARKIFPALDRILINFYIAVVQHLKKWEPAAPKVRPSAKSEVVDQEHFIDVISEHPKTFRRYF